MPSAGLANVVRDAAPTQEAPPDGFRPSLDALAIIVGNNLDRSEEDLADTPVPMGLGDTTRRCRRPPSWPHRRWKDFGSERSSTDD